MLARREGGPSLLSRSSVTSMSSGGCSLDIGDTSDAVTTENIDRVLLLLREEKAKTDPVSWAHIWGQAKEHTKQVYMSTYIAGIL